MRSSVARDPAIRVPELTALFWLTKILTTGVGETTSDRLGHSVPQLLAIAIAGLLVVVTFALQPRAGRYVPWRYWSLVTMVAVFGTMVADGLHLLVGLPYQETTPVFGLAVAVLFVLWRRVESTLSVHSVTTLRRELFYWATVMATFALGTALGDLTATGFGLGYAGSALLFLVAILVPAGLLRLGLPLTGAFWGAYVLTRPLGASIADWFAVPPERGGLGLGTLGVSVVGLLGIAALVTALQLRDARDGRGAESRVSEDVEAA